MISAKIPAVPEKTVELKITQLTVTYQAGTESGHFHVDVEKLPDSAREFLENKAKKIVERTE